VPALFALTRILTYGGPTSRFTRAPRRSRRRVGCNRLLGACLDWTTSALPCAAFATLTRMKAYYNENDRLICRAHTLVRSISRQCLVNLTEIEKPHRSDEADGYEGLSLAKRLTFITSIHITSPRQSPNGS
jgi:hypothetical protein